MALFGRSHSSLCWSSLEVDKKGQDMPKFCDGDNGKKNKSSIGKGHIALYEVQLERYAFYIAAKSGGGGLQPPSPSACLYNANYFKWRSFLGR